MEKETIDKLKELKQLVDEGVLTHEEFDREKKQLLSATPPVVEKHKDTKQGQRRQYKQRPSRTIHIPLLHRSVVMNQTTPEGVIKKCNNYIIRGNVALGLAVVLGGIFIYYCCTGGFWSIFGAIFWALIPALIWGISAPITKSQYTELRDKFVGMSQVEFEYVQEIIRNKRKEEKDAVISFANDFMEGVDQYAQSYQQQNGSNFYADLGAAIGSSL